MERNVEWGGGALQLIAIENQRFGVDHKTVAIIIESGEKLENNLNWFRPGLFHIKSKRGPSQIKSKLQSEGAVDIEMIFFCYLR